MIFTPEQIQELFLIIDNFQLFFIAEHIGVDYLTESEKATLKKHGIDIEALKADSFIEQAFKFGILTDALGTYRSKKLNYEDFKTHVQEGAWIPLNFQEQQTLKSLQFQAYSDIKGLGNRIKEGTGQVLIEADKKQRAAFEKVIKETAEETVTKRKGVKHMVSELGHKTGDWARDFGRISDYILHTSFDEGRAAHIERGYGKEALVYKDVYAGGCKHCISAYLTGSIGSQPKLFKLNDLRANGTNIGKKVQDWQPVIGAHHPWCRCTLHRLPEGHVWNEETKGFVLDTSKTNYGLPKNLNNFTIDVTVDGKTTTV